MCKISGLLYYEMTKCFNLRDLQVYGLNTKMIDENLYIYSRKSDLPPVEVQVSASQKQEDQIASAERNQNAQIPPPRIKTDRKRLVELIANAVSAVRTIRSRVVSDISRPAVRKERLHVVAACLTWGSREQVQFAG